MSGVAPGEAWASDVPVSQPQAASVDLPVLVDFGGIGFGAGGITFSISEADIEQIFTPRFMPEGMPSGESLDAR